MRFFICAFLLWAVEGDDSLSTEAVIAATGDDCPNVASGCGENFVMTTYPLTYGREKGCIWTCTCNTCFGCTVNGETGYGLSSNFASLSSDSVADFAKVDSDFNTIFATNYFTEEKSYAERCPLPQGGEESELGSVKGVEGHTARLLDTADETAEGISQDKSNDAPLKEVLEAGVASLQKHTVEDGTFNTSRVDLSLSAASEYTALTQSRLPSCHEPYLTPFLTSSATFYLMKFMKRMVEDETNQILRNTLSASYKVHRLTVALANTQDYWNREAQPPLIGCTFDIGIVILNKGESDGDIADVALKAVISISKAKGEYWCSADVKIGKIQSGTVFVSTISKEAPYLRLIRAAITYKLAKYVSALRFDIVAIT